MDDGNISGGTFDNKDFFGPDVQFDPAVGEGLQTLLFDAQTSGGLLLGVAPEKLAVFEQSARVRGQQFWRIGSVEEGDGIEVYAGKADR